MKKILFILLIVSTTASLYGNPHDLFKKGVGSYRRANYEGAVDYYSRCLKVIEAKRHHFVYNNRGLAYKKLKQPGKAMKDFMAAIRLKPGYAPAYNNIGLLYLDRGDYKKAMKLFNQSLEFDGDYFVAYYNIACIHALQNRRALAVRFLTQAEKSASRRRNYLQKMYQELIRDRQLDNLRRYPPFQKLIKKIERKLRMQRI